MARRSRAPVPRANADRSARQASSPQSRADVLQTIFTLVNARDDTLCNFADLPPGQTCFGEPGEQVEDLRVIYRRFATLCFCLVVDESESELAILDLIQVGATRRG